MKLQDIHKRALEKLDSLVDLEHLRDCERLQEDIWLGRAPDRFPCYVSFPVPADWPAYSFTECWNDPEKNFITGLSASYNGVLLKDDRLCTLTPSYGVVNIPELFGVKSIITDQGRSMSEGLGDTGKIKELIGRGVPDIHQASGSRVEIFEDFAVEVLGQYERLSKAVHLTIADTSGMFDLAGLIWGHDIFYAIYDSPDIVHQLLELLTRTYTEFSVFHKKKLNEPMNSAYHICGLKLVRGGVRICIDSCIPCSRKAYLEFVRPYNIRAFAPFEGGWIHHCGNGRHIIDDILATPGTHALHLGNPDYYDLYELYQKTRSADVVLIWSGSLERIGDVLKFNNASGAPKGLMVLTENRYASPGLEEARKNLERIRSFKPINRAPY